MPKSQQKKRTSIEDKFKTFQEIVSGQPKCYVPRNTISTWLLPANKEKIMAAFSSGTINLLDALIMLEQLWPALLETTIINYFKNAGTSKESQYELIKDTDDPFAQLAEVLDKLRSLDPDLAPDDLTVETFIALDEKVATCIQSLPCDEELLHQLAVENNNVVAMIDDESNKMESTRKKQSSKKTVFKAMDLIEIFALFQSDDIAKQFRKHTAMLNELLALSSRKNQSTIPSYLKSNVNESFCRNKSTTVF